MTTPIRRLIAIIGVAAVTAAVLTVTAYWPHTSPRIIHLKSRLLGAGFVCGELWSHNERWQTVVAGVRAGEQRYLGTAVDCYPTLFGESAYDMIEAVSLVVERNPRGAITTLLPTYGVGIVCGAEGMNEGITPEGASRRLKILQAYAGTAASTPDLIACVREAEAEVASPNGPPGQTR
jgi:hypothetical protein